MADTKSAKKHVEKASDGGGAVYGLGFLGAVVYFIKTADGFWDGLLGILQAAIWPAIVVYKLLESFFS